MIRLKIGIVKSFAVFLNNGIEKLFRFNNLEKFVVGSNFFGHADGGELVLLGGVGGMAVVVVDFGDIDPERTRGRTRD